MDTQYNNSRNSAGEEPSPLPLSNIATPGKNDVLCGRGGLTNGHIGNGNWRAVVKSNKRLYVRVQKRQKMLVAKSIVLAIRSQDPPGRFLKKDDKTGKWNDIGDQKAQEKTSQALREGASAIRDEMEDTIKLREDDTMYTNMHSSTSPTVLVSPAVSSPLPCDFPTALPPTTNQPTLTREAPIGEVCPRWPYLRSNGIVEDTHHTQSRIPARYDRESYACTSDPLLRREAPFLTPPLSSAQKMESVVDPAPRCERIKELSHNECADIVKNTTIWGSASGALSTLATVAQSEVANAFVSDPMGGQLKHASQDKKVDECKGVREEQLYSVIEKSIVPVSRERGGMYRDPNSPIEYASVVNSVVDSAVEDINSVDSMQLDVQSQSMPDFTELVRDTSIAMTDMSLSREVSPTTGDLRKALVNGRAHGVDSAVFSRGATLPEQSPNMSYTEGAFGCDSEDVMQGKQKSRVEHHIEGDSIGAVKTAVAGVDEEEQLEITYLNRGPSLALQDFSKTQENGEF